VAEVFTETHSIVQRDSIEALVGHRNKSLELALQALELLVDAERAAKRAAPNEKYAGFLSRLDRDINSLSWFDDEDMPIRQRIRQVLKTITKEVDTHAWTSLQTLSGLRNIMDTEAVRDFHEQLKKKTPAFSVDNITATFMELSADSGKIFIRGLLNVFKSLDHKRYKSNSAFCITPRAVMTRVFSGGGWNHYGSGQEVLIDLDRIFHVLDRKKPPEAGNIADLIMARFRAGYSTFEGQYFEGRMFHGNGNLHMKFKRQDLLDVANGLIAKHYGEVIPDNRRSNRAQA
jgi:hypothetical protein